MIEQVAFARSFSLLEPHKDLNQSARVYASSCDCEGETNE